MIDHVKFNKSLLSKYKEPKRVIGSFTTHDEMSPVLINGAKYSKMIMWLNATLPVNTYLVDGMQTGDNYVYFWANKKAPKTYTDDEYYFVHRGKIDIFNFSRRPGGNDKTLIRDYVMANKFKVLMYPLLTNGKFIPLKASQPSVFAYAISYSNNTVLVFGNLNFTEFAETKIRVPKLDDNALAVPIKIESAPVYKNGYYNVKLTPGEIQVLVLQGVELGK